MPRYARGPNAKIRPPPPDPAGLTASEFGAAIRRSDAFTYGLMARGEIEWVTLGKRGRVILTPPRQYLEHLAKAQKPPSDAPQNPTREEG